MKVLVVGSGGREHALVWKLARSPQAERIFCAPGSGGTEALAENIPIQANDLLGLARFATDNNIGLTVIGPDDPLAAGIVDLFQERRLRVFGPTKAAAQLEASKVFAKQLMTAQAIPTATARSFSSADEALRYCETVEPPVVIKADGLALGKGVIIADDHEQARQAIRSMMEYRVFGEAGRHVLIEEFLHGTECSVHALVSGGRFRILGTARDHKRALDGDLGPNTGGMGALSPADNWGPKRQDQFAETVMRPLLTALAKSGTDFRGLLFPGLMITRDGLRVLEFNCRFGDPEAQAILPRVTTDLLPALLATIDGDLNGVPIELDPRPSVTVVIASGGYPGRYETGKPITGLARAAAIPDVEIFHAGTRVKAGEIVTAGGRVLAITALGSSISEARERAYTAASTIQFEGSHFRRDIALSSGQE